MCAFTAIDVCHNSSFDADTSAKLIVPSTFWCSKVSFRTGAINVLASGITHNKSSLPTSISAFTISSIVAAFSCDLIELFSLHIG